jgi:uncharacterized tellurite resistance protein B-like protein
VGTIIDWGIDMIDMVKKFFGKLEPNKTGNDRDSQKHDLHVAVCALCIEMARIDNNFTKQELKTLLTILKQKYHLSTENAQALMAAADQALEQSVDLWQFAQLVNENYSIDEKLGIIEILWQIVFVDGKMDEHEHYLMNKLSTLLRLSHNQLIDTKLKVLHKEKRKN